MPGLGRLHEPDARHRVRKGSRGRGADRAHCKRLRPRRAGGPRPGKRGWGQWVYVFGEVGRRGAGKARRLSDGGGSTVSWQVQGDNDTALMSASYPPLWFINVMPGGEASSCGSDPGNVMPGVVEKLLAAGARAHLRNVRSLKPFCFPPTRQCPPTTLPLAVWHAYSCHIRAKLAPSACLICCSFCCTERRQNRTRNG